MASLTTLNEDLDTTETGVDITPAVTAATRPAYILVDDEIMSVSAGTTSLTVGRSAYGTAAAAHLNTTAVYEVARVEMRADSLLVYYIASDGTLNVKRIVIAGDSVGGLASGSVYAVDAMFTETAAAGTYTVNVPVTSGTRLLDVLWHTTAVWAATTTLLKVGLTADDDAFVTAANVDATDTAANSNPAVGAGWGANNAGILSGAKSGYVFANDDVIDIIIVTTGSGGTTGRTRVQLLLVQPLNAIAATKV